MNKKDVKTKEDLELYYSKCRKIKFPEEITDNVDDVSLPFIFNNIAIHYNSSPTEYTRGGYHCRGRKRRSLDDYIKLVKYYHSQLPLSTIISEFIKLCDEHKLLLAYCPNIRKENLWEKNQVYYGGRMLHDRSWRDQGFINCNLTLEEVLT